MNRLTKIEIPKGIFYLGNYPQLLQSLPSSGRYVFNKVMTGCGATTMFLDDPVPTVLCSPRKELIHCKANSGRYFGKVHLFGSRSDNVIDKINDVKNYIDTLRPTPFSTPSHSPKILITYDSTKHIIQALSEMGLLGAFKFVVDEFQTLFTDAAFRGDTEAEFMTNVKNPQINSVVFMSATPYLESYLDMVSDFKDLDYIELSWPASSIHATDITMQPYYNGSPSATMKRVIDRFKTSGYFEEMMDERGCAVRAYESVFFVNDVAFIINTIRKNGLPLDQVNIICADNDDNKQRLKKYGLTIGHAQKEGDSHVPFTFATKASFEGTDFYSPSAYTYIFSNINRKNLALDISLDLPQIMGRQRLDSNPFKYSGTLFYKTKPDFSEAEKKAFMDEISSKTSITDQFLQEFNGITDPGMRARYARKFRNAQKAEFYGDDYLSVVDDKSESGPKCVFNEYVRANELRAWDVQMHQYTGIAYVMGSVNSTFSSCGATTELIRDFLPTFTGPFEQKMKMYAEFLDAHPECKEELQRSVSVPNEIKRYYNELGSGTLRSLSWKHADIERFLAASPLSENELGEIISAEFPESWYSLKDIKTKLQGVYDRYGLNRTAKATDLEQYIPCCKKKGYGADYSRINGYQFQRPQDNN